VSSTIPYGREKTACRLEMGKRKYPGSQRANRPRGRDKIEAWLQPDVAQVNAWQRQPSRIALYTECAALYG
jgi:hypothetical protein